MSPRLAALRSTHPWLVRLLALPALILVGVTMAATSSMADGQGDITVSVNVVDSSPTNVPTAQTVSLTSGQSITSAKVEIVLVGLEPYSLVQIYAQSTPVLIASGFADKLGTFRALASLPPTLEAGSHSVVASAQKKGQTAPTLVSLVQFVVSTNGTLTNTTKGTKGYKPGSGSGSGVTESPAPSTTAVPQEILDGVLFVGGLGMDATPNLSPAGPGATARFTLMNAYKRAYTLSVDETVKAWGVGQISRVSNYSVTNLKPREARTILRRIPRIGQWGLYTVDLTVTPPAKLDALTLPEVHRQSVVLVVPLLPVLVLLILVAIELIRRSFLMPYLRGRRLLQNLLVEPEVRGNE
ncbi:MAG: hypothetical protein ACKOWK_07010 [Micrococcales bacterium]